MTHDFGSFKEKPCVVCSKTFLPYHPKTKYCSKDCSKIIDRKKTKEWKKNHPRRYKNSKIKTAYGITIEQYEQLYEDQNGKCGICEKSLDRPNIDHCHTTGGVRGLLCSKCNRAIGQLGDSIEGLMKAVKYLQGYYNERS